MMDSGSGARQHDAKHRRREAALIKIETPTLKTEGARTFDSYYARPETGRGHVQGHVQGPVQGPGLVILTEMMAVTIATPADGPSFGVAPSGT